MSILARIADLVLNQPLLLTPDKAEVIAGILSGRIGIEGPELSRFEGSPVVIDEAGRAQKRPYMVSNGVAIITITGSLVNRGAWVGAYSGITSYEGIQHQLKTARDAGEVKAVLLDLHSPGGEAVGTFETAALVREVAAKKPVTAVVNGMACSAAYAIASGATSIVTTSSGVSGSIGVISLHVDASRQLENDGLKPTLIIAGSHKADGHPFGPLPDAVRADFQARIDGIYQAFLECVAVGRGERLSADMAKATEARIYIGKAAVAAGLADAEGTFESVLADLTRAAGRTSLPVKGKRMAENNEGAPAAEAPAGITKADLDAAVAKATADVSAGFEAKLKADRERMASIDELTAMVGDNKDALKIIADAKADGSSADSVALKLAKSGAFTKAAVLGAIKEDDKSASGAGPAAEGKGGTVPQTEAGWTAEWEGSDALKGEYPEAADYAAFKKLERKEKGAK